MSKVDFSFGKKPVKKLISKLMIVGAVLAVGIVSGISYGLVRSIILTGSQENALKEAQKASLEIDQWLTELRSQVESIANNSDVRSMSWSKAEPFLQLELDRLPSYYMFSLINTDGSYYTTTTGFVENKNLRDLPHVQKPLAGKTHISQPIISRSTGIYQISVCAPIWSVPPLYRQPISPEQASTRTQSLKSFNLPSSPSQKPVVKGALCGLLPIKNISKIIEKISNVPDDSYAFVLDVEGIPIAHPDPQILQARKSFLADSNTSLATLAKNMVNREEGIELKPLKKSSSVYIAYTPIQKADWSVGLVIPQERLEAQLRPLNLLAAVIGTLLILATIFAIWQVKLFEETRDQATREALVNQLTEQIRASLDLNTLLQIAVNEVMKSLGLSWVGFSWYHTEQKRLEVVCSSSSFKLAQVFPKINALIEETFADFSVSSEMINLRKLEEVHLKEKHKADFQKAGVCCYFSLPIRVNNSQIGYLMGLSKTAISNDKAILKLLNTIQGQLVIAITQANLYKQVQEQVELLNQTLRERSEAQAQLQQKMEMLDRSSNGIIIWDMNDKIIYWNQGAENLYGWKKTEAINQNIHNFLRTNFITSKTELMEKFIQKGSWNGELKHQTKDNETLVIFSRWTLQRDERGNPHAILEINSDITERKAAETALAYSEAQLREKASQLEATLAELQRTQAQVIQNEKMSSLGQLVGGVAHEINNPVSFIYGNLTHAEEYMQDLINLLHLYQEHYPADSTPEIQDEIETIDLEFIEDDFPKILKSMKNGTKRIEDIVVSLRNFSRMDEADLKQVNIHEGIDSTLMILQNRLNVTRTKTPINVIKNYGNLPKVECYPGRLNQVFMNLLTNAIDAIQDKYNQLISETQETAPTIEISTEFRENEWIQIRIKDNGSGISESVQNRLFDPFFTTKPVGKGTGLGLSISYQIITDKHKGKLSLNSQLEEGAEFIIEIPKKQS